MNHMLFRPKRVVIQTTLSLYIVALYALQISWPIIIGAICGLLLIVISLEVKKPVSRFGIAWMAISFVLAFAEWWLRS
ncbi:hypothetical protein GZ78_11505 [Endozoicomonas numazuensis]|uniref:Uncharacterized protein n=1 Tax=Endozoicomonas numazuensis TaxID=1137799 RepID=A0A081NI97_9GAMM|nr:hypothetical protein GZ78_11505 [Endozoicomonas numazuensis]